MTDMKGYKPPAIASSDEGNILPSCGDLFVYYKKCMKQCSELSDGQVRYISSVSKGKCVGGRCR